MHVLYPTCLRAVISHLSVSFPTVDNLALNVFFFVANISPNCLIYAHDTP